MEVINNFLAVWGFISIIICIISFFVSSTEYKDCVLILDNPVNDDLKKLTFYHEYPHEYPINEPWQEKTLFVAKNCPVRNIKVYSYNVEKEKWEKKPSMVYKSLEPNEGIIFNIIRPEGMPMHKIKWQIDYGATCQYIFSYNGFSGNHNMDYCCYHYNFLSKIRKLIGYR